MNTETRDPVEAAIVETAYKGGKIDKPGIYQGVPIERYHNDIALFDRWSISSSGLKRLIERPSLYWAYSPYNDNRFDDVVTPQMNFGRAAHLLFLGEKDFREQFAVQPETYDSGSGEKKWSNNANVCKAWQAKQKEAGRSVLTATDIETVKHMADSLERHPIIRAGALRGRIERTMVAHEGTIALRARPDVVPTDGGDFTDLKTAASVDYDSLQRTVFQTGLHIQAAVVRMVAQAVMPEGWQFGEFLLVFVEKKPPFDVVPVVLKPSDIDLGERQVRAALSTLETCISENRWPGSGEGSLGYIEMPAWARTRTETELNVNGATA